MLAGQLQFVFLTSFVTLSMVAVAMWLLYQQRRERAFLFWMLAFAAGALRYGVEAIAAPQPVVFGIILALSAARGVLLVAGVLAQVNVLPRWYWLLLLIDPLWVAIGLHGQWAVWEITLLSSAGATLGYSLLALRFRYSLTESNRLIQRLFAAVTMVAGLCILAGLLQSYGFELERSIVGQMAHLLMTLLLLLMLLQDQEQQTTLARAGKEGALQRVRLSRQRMEELNEWTDKLLHQVSDGVVVCNAEGKIISFNGAAERIFGYDQSEMAGRFFEELIVPKAWQAFSQVWIKGSTQEDGHHELEGVHRSGMVLSLDVSVSDLRMGEQLQRMVILRDVSERKKQESRLNFFAEHDALTGLYNRHHFERELQKMLERNSTGWLVFLDLDDFKLINDALGHQAGDTALVAMSKRLLTALGENALIARYSGDEFVFFVPSTIGWDEDGLLGELNQLLHQPVSSSGMEFMLSGSLGVVRVPEHGNTVAVLLRNADLAMYQAKRQGKNKFSLYTTSLFLELGRKADMATRLKSLVPDEQLSVFFQPRVALPDRDLCGAEALLRWRTPEGDYISPEQFIPVAEETGQILRIGYWVMEQACRWLSGWTTYRDPFVVSINLSPRQLFDERLVERIEALRLRYGLAAAQLEFEITESSAMQDPEYAIKVLLRLRALGYGLSLDDFGTGFSSLSQLRRLPVNVLKIDKSFVQNIANDRHDRVMVAAIIELAVHLNLSVLAEGVETADQLRLLDALGCNEVQGYLVSQPLPAEQFAEDVLINWNRYCRSLAW